MIYDPKAENAKRAAKRRFEARELLHKLKSEPCVDCGQKYHPCQMDFIRINESNKAPVSRLLLRSKETILKDISECDLLCANCGRMRVWEKQRMARSGPV